MTNLFFEIFNAFSIGFLIILGPSILVASTLKEGRLIWPKQLMPLMLFFLAVFFIASSLFVRFFVPSLGSLIASILIATALCTLLARTLKYKIKNEFVEKEGSKYFWISVILSTLAIASCVWIYCSLSWGYDGKIANIVSPMQLDPQRNANIVASILRGDKGVFLPNDPILYQLLWYRGAALLMTALPATTTPYFQVGGLTILTGWMLYFTLVTIALRSRRDGRFNLIPLLALTAYLLVDARVDDLNFFKTIINLLYGGQTHPSINLEYFSLKLLALTAPQHSLFFIFFVGAIYFRDFSSKFLIWRVPLWSFLAVSAVISSPVLAIFLFPSYALADILVSCLSNLRTGARRALELCSIAVTAFCLHWVIIGFPPSDLFDREGAVSLTSIWNEGFSFQNRIIPLIPFWIFGFTLGTFIIYLAWSKFKSFRKSNSRYCSSANTVLITSLIIFILWNILITDVETRRHSSMVLVVLLSFLSAILYSQMFTAYQSRWSHLYVIAIFLVGIVLEFKFIRAYTTDAVSVLSQDIPWNDYFLANKYLKENERHRGVIAASGEGVVLPIANSAAVTLAPALAMMVHQRASGEVKKLVNSSRNSYYKGGLLSSEIDLQWLKNAQNAGFDTVIWGPVEEAVWGSFGRRILTDSATLKATFGEVGIFEFSTRNALNIKSHPNKEEEIIRKIFFEKVSCNSYIRTKIRELKIKLAYLPEGYYIEKSKLDSLEGREFIGSSLRDVLKESQCNDNILLTPLAKEYHFVGHEKELQLSAIGIARQSSIRSNRIDIHGPRNAIKATSLDKEVNSKSLNVREDKANPWPISFTDDEASAWWELDLGRNFAIAAVQIEWATSLRANIDKHLYLLISTHPFPEESPVDPYKSEGNMFLVSRDLIKLNNPISTQSALGRFIRIQIDGDGYLALKQIRIWINPEHSK